MLTLELTSHGGAGASNTAPGNLAASVVVKSAKADTPTLDWTDNLKKRE